MRAASMIQVAMPVSGSLSTMIPFVAGTPRALLSG
jgi:hypothetical protein